MSSVGYDNRIDGTRVGNWMQTYTGRAFYPIDPRPEEIEIEDIAQALSKQCRYAGHTKRFYSVAEHCVHLYWKLPREFKLWGLLHDASEAYLTDIIRPVKSYLTGYLDLEEKLMRAVAERFYMKWPMPPMVKEFDNRILLDERNQIMANPPHDWNIVGEPLGVDIQCWDPERAFHEFMHCYDTP
jgi:hypothetical protein